MNRINWGIAAAGAMLAVGPEAFFGFGLWFNPGWANAWPGGIPIDVAWAGGLAAYLFIFLMTVVFGFVAAVLALSVRPGKPSPRFRIIAALIAPIVLAGLAVSVWVYGHLHVTAQTMWPNGYHPGQ
jgi:hypothetical protein